MTVLGSYGYSLFEMKGDKCYFCIGLAKKEGIITKVQQDNKRQIFYYKKRREYYAF